MIYKIKNELLEVINRCREYDEYIFKRFGQFETVTGKSTNNYLKFNINSVEINLMGNKAITVLDSILDDENVSSNVRLNASKSILDMILKFNEQRNIMDKMKEIEELLNEKVGASNG